MNSGQGLPTSSQHPDLLEASVLGVLYGMLMGAAGWYSLPFLAALVAVQLACRAQTNQALPENSATSMHLWVCVLIMGATLGASRTHNFTHAPPRDPLSDSPQGRLPGVGPQPRSTRILWIEVVDNPTPTFSGWRVKSIAEGQEALLYGTIAEELPLRGDGLIARCKSTQVRGITERSPSLSCNLISPGIVARDHLGFMEILTGARFEVIRRFLQPSPSDASRAAAALTTGAKGLISPIRRDQLARLGLLHLWAVSGLHILFLAGAASFLLRRAWGRIFPGRARPAPRVLGALSALPIVLTYATFVGGTPSALRAATAFGIFTALQFSRRPANGRRLWLLTCAIELICTTNTLLSPGALLSHSASAGILFLFSDTQPPNRHGASGWKKNILSTFRAGAGATIATAPLSIAFFGSIAPLGVLVGLLWVPLISLIILPLCLLSGLTIISGAPSALSLGLVSATTTLMDIANTSLDFLDAPGIRFSLSPWWCAAFAPLAIFTLVTWNGDIVGAKDKSLFRWALAISIPLLFAINQLKAAPAPSETLVTALSIGHGDAFLVRPATGEVILIDTGPGQSDGTRSALSPERLRRLGVSKIDLLVLTHRHSDHFGGAFRLFPEFPIERCLTPHSPVQPRGFEWPALAASAAAAGVKCLPVAAGHVVKGRGFNLEILFPLKKGSTFINPAPGDSPDEAPSENLFSLIARLQTADGLIWVIGDSPTANEEKVMGTRPTNILGGVLLVPHHGSTTSSSITLLEQTKPHAALVSHGKKIPAATEKKYRDRHIALCGTYPGGTAQIRLLAGITLVPLACLWE